MTSQTIIAFDLYGTLLSTASIAKQLATHFGDEKADEIAALWRRYQLEYTFRLNSMSIYKPFSAVTHTSLLHALADSSVTLKDSEISDLMSAYDRLSIFPDVSAGLKTLSASPHLSAYIFSNGTSAMIGTSVHESPELSPYEDLFKGLVTVEEPKRFKPAKEVYEHLFQKVGKSWEKEGERESVWLVSGNPFDVVGARAVGMSAAWIDRAGKGWTDRCGMLIGEGDGVRPSIVAGGVDEAVSEILKWDEARR